MERATRDAYGRALVELGSKYRDIVVLDADLSGSTKSGEFRKAYPDRFFNLGIAESNMVDVAAGLALSGLKPYVSSFAVFVTGRAFESVRQSVCYQNLGVTLCGSHSGISVGEDGGSHQAVVDIAIMRSLPNMHVIVPADYNEAYHSTIKSYEIEGPVYIRTSRAKSPVFTEDKPFELKGKVLLEGKDATVVACGFMVYLTLEASKLLQKEGISIEVINMPVIKPLDGETVYASSKKTGVVFTIEEHSVIGGLGGAVCEFLAENNPVKVHRIGIQDVFGESGSKEDLFCKFGFTAELLARAIKQKLNG